MECLLQGRGNCGVTAFRSPGSRRSLANHTLDYARHRTYMCPEYPAIRLMKEVEWPGLVVRPAGLPEMARKWWRSALLNDT